MNKITKFTETHIDKILYPLCYDRMQVMCGNFQVELANQNTIILGGFTIVAKGNKTIQYKGKKYRQTSFYPLGLYRVLESINDNNNANDSDVFQSNEIEIIKPNYFQYNIILNYDGQIHTFSKTCDLCLESYSNNQNRSEDIKDEISIYVNEYLKNNMKNDTMDNKKNRKGFRFKWL